MNRVAAVAAVVTLCASGMSSPWPANAAEPDVAAVLRAVDRFRTGADALQVETRVTTLAKDGATDKERNYTVFLQPERRTLVLMRSAAEQGQKVLMLGDDFWLMLPNSQRALRITPAQKLLGDASTGDIATMRWADDYSGSVVGEEKCGEQPQPCLKLALTASRKGASYARIDLWVGKTLFEPLHADLYVLSGKLAKQAQFVMDNPRAPTQVAEMVLADQLGNVKETRIKYVSRRPRTVPAEWLNPMFLATNPALE